MSSWTVVATKILEIPSCEVCGEIGLSVKTARFITATGDTREGWAHESIEECRTNLLARGLMESRPVYMVKRRVEP
jgi:hypothetical protein